MRRSRGVAAARRMHRQYRTWRPLDEEARYWLRSMRDRSAVRCWTYTIASRCPRRIRFWQHPRVFVTPHTSAQAIAELAVSQVIENIRRIERCEAPLGLVDPARGY